jgi:hypothetical protein
MVRAGRRVIAINRRLTAALEPKIVFPAQVALPGSSAADRRCPGRARPVSSPVAAHETRGVR